MIRLTVLAKVELQRTAAKDKHQRVLRRKERRQIRHRCMDNMNYFHIVQIRKKNVCRVTFRKLIFQVPKGKDFHLPTFLSNEINKLKHASQYKLYSLSSKETGYYLRILLSLFYSSHFLSGIIHLLISESENIFSFLCEKLKVKF